MKYTLGLVTILFLVSCGKTSLNAEVGQTFKMQNEQSVNVAETDLKLKGFAITEDSRCPQGTNCIWAGQVVARVELNGAPLKFNSVKAVDTLGYSFLIKSVTPLKKEGVEIPISSYILEILISKYTQTASPLETE